jgi:hypothetical protein
MKRKSVTRSAFRKITLWWASASVNRKEMDAPVVSTAQLVVESSRCRHALARLISARKRWTIAAVKSLERSSYPR